jgi:hypothetical protein
MLKNIIALAIAATFGAAAYAQAPAATPVKPAELTKPAVATPAVTTPTKSEVKADVTKTEAAPEVTKGEAKVVTKHAKHKAAHKAEAKSEATEKAADKSIELKKSEAAPAAVVTPAAKK